MRHGPAPRGSGLGRGVGTGRFPGAKCVALVMFTIGSAMATTVSAQPPEVAPAPEAAPADAILQAEQARVEAIARAVPTAVSIFVPGGAGGGSGVLISPDGYALTNFHVSSPAGSYMRCGLSDGKIYDAVVVGIDPVGDLAMIRLLGRDDFPAAELGDSDTLRAGQWCFVVGNPFLLATNLEPTVTWGMLSGVHRYQYPDGTLLEYADCLQTDASINPGNSGGPIFDAEGRLIGIVGRASFEKRGRVNVGVGYAISINQAKNFLGYLKSGRIVDHATLGATVVTDPDGGVRVSNILESSDAYRRGLRYDDEILEVAGRVVHTANDVQNVLGTLPQGWRIPMAYARNGQRHEILVRLAGVHGEGELIEKMATVLPPPPPAPQPQPDPEQPAQPSEGDAEAAPQDGAEEDSDRPKGSDGNPIPEVVAAHLEERPGFANYHFNRVHQQRLYESLKTHAPTAAESSTPWVIKGTLEGATASDVILSISDERLSMQVGNQELAIDSVAARFDAVDSRSEGAILPALDAWRRMIALGPQRFGEVHYLGTAPLLGQRPLRDVLVGTAGELESRFYSHPERGVLESVELAADRSRDPAELIIEWGERSDNSPAAPAFLELRYGTDVLMRIRIQQWNSGTPTEQS